MRAARINPTTNCTHTNALVQAALVVCIQNQHNSSSSSRSRPGQQLCSLVVVPNLESATMSGWGPPDGGHKRRAEQSLQVASKRHHLGDVNPGREYVEPRVYQQPSYAVEQDKQQVRGQRSTAGPPLGPDLACSWQCRHVSKFSSSHPVPHKQ